jgi:hypothetical protein
MPAASDEAYHTGRLLRSATAMFLPLPHHYTKTTDD